MNDNSAAFKMAKADMPAEAIAKFCAMLSPEYFEAENPATAAEWSVEEEKSSWKLVD